MFLARRTCAVRLVVLVCFLFCLKTSPTVPYYPLLMSLIPSYLFLQKWSLTHLRRDLPSPHHPHTSSFFQCLRAYLPTYDSFTTSSASPRVFSPVQVSVFGSAAEGVEPVFRCQLWKYWHWKKLPAGPKAYGAHLSLMEAVLLKPMFGLRVSMILAGPIGSSFMSATAAVQPTQLRKFN